MANDSEEEKLERKKKHDAESAADLEKVTDFAEEKEIISTETNLSNILSSIAEQKKEERLKQVAYDKKLAKIAINKEDVELIMKELEIPKPKAERTLRENNGDVIAALTTLVTS